MKIKFFRKTLSFFIIPVMIPIMILGALSVVTLNRYMCSNMDARYQDRLFSYLTTIDAMMNEVDWLNTSLSTNPSIHTRLKKIIKKCTGGIPAESYVEVNTIVDLLYSSYDANPTVESIYIYFDNTSRYFLSSTNRISNLDFFFDQSWYDSYQSHRDDPEKSWSEFRIIAPYDFTNSTKKLLSIYRMIYSPGKQKPEGVLVLNIREDDINRKLDLLVPEPDHMFYITDENQRVIFANSQAEITGEHMLDGIAASIPNQRIVIGEESCCVYTMKSQNLGWRYYLIIPERTVYLLPNRLIRISAMLILIALVLSTGSAWFFAQKIYQSLIGIADIFDRASNGKELPSLVHREHDIYSFILYNIVETFLKNDFLQIQLSERHYKLKTMELMALQSQINPHFLMNTLQTVYWRCISLTKEPNPAAVMLENLSDILHYSLESSQELVGLDEELKITKCYLDIQIERYKEQFDVLWDIRKGVEATAVPKLILQPLIENCIYHGIRNKERHSTIKIRISAGKEQLRITVADNGLGMNQSQQILLWKRLNEEDTQMGVHIGLLNTHKRLQLIYGTAYHIRIYSSQNRGTAIQLVIPWLEKEAAVSE